MKKRWTKQEIRGLVDAMRHQGRKDEEIAQEIRLRCGISPLASHRLLHGWSQAEAARKFEEKAPSLTLDQTALSRLEIWPGEGGRSPLAIQIIAFSEVYGVSALSLLSPEGLDKMSARERDVLIRVGKAGPGSEPETDAAPASLSPVTSTQTPPVTGTLERHVQMAANRALSFGVLAEGSNVGAESIDQLFDEAARISRSYPQVPLNQVFGDLVQSQEVVFRLLEGRQRPGQTKDLYLLGGLLCLMLAKASHDVGDPQSAMKQARTAYICADNAEHDGLRVRVRAQQSLMAYWAGWQTDAARYAELAQNVVDKKTGTGAVWLLAQAARTWAALGNGERAVETLQKAEEAREQMELDDLDEMGGLHHFAHCRQLYYGAETRIWVPGQEMQAATSAQEAVAAYEEARTAASVDWAFGDEAGARADLALARASLGEIEGAAEALEPVLALPQERRIAGIVGSVVRVQSALRAPEYSGSAAVNRLRAAIDAFGQTPAALTAG